MLELKTNALISKGKNWGCFYTSFCERFVDHVPTLRRELWTIIIKTPLHSLYSSKRTTIVDPGEYQRTCRKVEHGSNPKIWALSHAQFYENALGSCGEMESRLTTVHAFGPGWFKGELKPGR